MQKETRTQTMKRLASFVLVLMTVFTLAVTTAPAASAATNTTYYTITNSSTSGKWFSVPYRVKDTNSCVYLDVQLVYGSSNVMAQVWSGDNQTLVGTVSLSNHLGEECLIRNNVYESGRRSAKINIYVPAKTKVRFWWSPDSVNFDGHTYYTF